MSAETQRRPSDIGDAESYDTVAASFARFTDVTTKPLAETIINLAEPKPGETILDLGAGTGIVALEAARRTRNSGRIVAVDISEGMLRTGLRKAADASLGNLCFARGDAERLPFAAGSFDRVVSLFALLHFSNPEKALAEMVRVLRPGARIVVGFGSPPPRSLSGYLHRLSRVPDFIRLRTGRLLLAPAHLEQVVKRLQPMREEPAHHARMGSREMIDLIRGAGLEDIRTHWEGHRFTLANAQESWELQRTFSSFARKRLQAAGDEENRRVRLQFDRECARVLARGGSMEYHYAAYFISGTRPKGSTNAPR
jgi:ubiquinone/menaquinone biosynthesis C-methylase UbiE